MNTQLLDSLRLTCNWCRYNLTVSEQLVPWASEVMLAHAKRQHPSQAAFLTEPTEKEVPTDDQSSPSPALHS